MICSRRSERPAGPLETAGKLDYFVAMAGTTLTMIRRPDRQRLKVAA